MTTDDKKYFMCLFFCGMAIPLRILYGWYFGVVSYEFKWVFVEIVALINWISLSVKFLKKKILLYDF